MNDFIVKHIVCAPTSIAFQAMHAKAGSLNTVLAKSMVDIKRTDRN